MENIDIIYNLDDETPISIRDDILRVDWYNAGEGLSGDYNPNNPEDRNLLRFDVYVNSGDKDFPWEDVEDASYCTQVSADTNLEILRNLLMKIFKCYRREISSYPIYHSVKKLGEELSWINKDWLLA